MAKRRSSQPKTNKSPLASALSHRSRSPRDSSITNSAAENQVGSGRASSGFNLGRSAAAESTDADFSNCKTPSATVRGLISLAIIVQVLSLLLAYSSNLAPSYLQGRILNVVGPFLHLTHQYYHALPLELTRADPLDFPLRIELQAEAANRSEGLMAESWQPLALATLFGDSRVQTDVHDTRWQNLARWLTLVASADPESEILSDFAARAVVLAEKQTGQRYQAVRLLSPKVLSYDEDLALAGNLREPTDEMFQPSVLYSASVVRLGGSADASGADRQSLSLIPTQDSLRTAKPTESTKELP